MTLISVIMIVGLACISVFYTIFRLKEYHKKIERITPDYNI
jgi:hypothetical protein